MGSTADGIGEGWGAGVPLMDSLQLETMGEDGRDKVSSLIDCFALCLLLRVTLANGNFEDFSMLALVRLSFDGDKVGDVRGVVDLERAILGSSYTLVWSPENLCCLRDSSCSCHELAFFTLFSLLFYCIDTCCYSLESYSNANLHSLLSISPPNFVSDHQRKINSACIQSHNVANTTLKLQRTARLETRRQAI